ncbi:hypothetical protein HPHPH4_1207 [Helicobacter pylori Hp H-4]|nr:hypothetical protein HPHPH4_1207 [Helicobacter pylori Hp H-4]
MFLWELIQKSALNYPILHQHPTKTAFYIVSVKKGLLSLK